MNLIQEADLDESFAAQLVKVDAALEKLEKLAQQFSTQKRPVRSQIAMVESAAEDFKKLATKLKEIHGAPNK